MELRLPELDRGWRWKIVPLYNEAWDAVVVRLQKKHWFFGWMTVRAESASTIVMGSDLNEETNKAARNLWERQWGHNPTNKISGVYYGDNQHREE